jgi:hypothetical protein
MSWKTINGSRYLYKSKRVNGRVVSEYKGTGYLVELEDKLYRLENERIKAEREAWQAEAAEMRQEDEQAAAIFDQVDTLTEAYLLTAGCYKHKGQWRRGDGRRKTT